MLSLTRKADYALVALAHLAQERQRGEGVVSARGIADQFGLPLPLLMNILKELTHARVVLSTRGPQGGYCLARDPAKITVAQVVAAMEGPVKLAACCSAPHDESSLASCPVSDACPIHSAINRLHQRLAGFLSQVTLADMIDARVDVTVQQVAG